MAEIGENRAAGGGIPYLHRSIAAGRGDTFSVGRPCYCLHAVLVAAIDNFSIAMRGIPDARAFVIAGRGNVRTEGRPGDRCDATAMPVTGEAHISGRWQGRGRAGGGRGRFTLDGRG